MLFSSENETYLIALVEIPGPKSRYEPASPELSLFKGLLGDVALVFSLELADDLEPGKPPRTTLPVMLEG